MKKHIISLVLAVALLLPAMSFAANLTDSQSEEACTIVSTIISGKGNTAYNTFKKVIKSSTSIKTDAEFDDAFLAVAVSSALVDYIDSNFSAGDIYVIKMEGGYAPIYTVIIPDSKGGCTATLFGVSGVAVSGLDYVSFTSNPKTVKDYIESEYKTQYTISTNTISGEDAYAILIADEFMAYMDSLL